MIKKKCGISCEQAGGCFWSQLCSKGGLHGIKAIVADGSSSDRTLLLPALVQSCQDPQEIADPVIMPSYNVNRAPFPLNSPDQISSYKTGGG